MGYFYLILQALIFSFGGLLIKSVGTMLSPFLTSCLRFTIGIAMLFLIQRLRTGKLRLTLTDRVILIGGVCKALHYLAENFGVMRGFSYGVVLVWPVQTVVIFLVSRLFYKQGSFIRKGSITAHLRELFCVLPASLPFPGTALHFLCFWAADGLPWRHLCWRE